MIEMNGKNISLTNLAILRSVHQSPLLSCTKSGSYSNFFLSFSKFHQISNHVLYSLNLHGFLSISRSNFHKTLSSAIYIDSIQLSDLQISETKTINEQEIEIDSCVFTFCNGTNGACISSKESSISIISSIFKYNTAKSGGAISCINTSSIRIEQSSFCFNSAEYTGAVNLDSAKEVSDANIKYNNISHNRANQWTGAMRVDRNGGNLNYLIFTNNSATFCGCFFDFTWLPSIRSLDHCLFNENSAIYKGGAYCCFHVKHESRFSNCIFSRNACEYAADSISIETVDIKISLSGCFFSGSKEEEITMNIDGSLVDIEKCSFHFVEKMETSIKSLTSEVLINIPNQ